MSFLAQAFQSSVATNTFSTMSRLNSTDVSLNTAGIFTGQFEFCGQYSVIQVNVSSDQDTTLYVKQSYDGTTQNIVAEARYDISGGNNPFFLGDTKYTYITYPYYRIEVVNTGGAPMTKLFVSTKLTLTSPPATTDPISGALDVVVTNFPAVQDVSGSVIVSNFPAVQDVSGSVIVSNFPAVQDVSGSVIVSNFPAVQDVNIVTPNPLPISGLVTITADTSSVQAWAEDTATGEYYVLSSTSEVRNALTYHKLDTYDFSANNTLTSIDTKLTTGVLAEGQNTDFAFYPDANNLTPAIYADGDQPIATNQAGWVYTNSNPQKINWYVYQNPTLPQYLVSEMNSIYFVVSQITSITSATELPFIVFYTMPDGIDDAIPNFAKSRLVFAPDNGVPTAEGEYLLYVKSDPVGIRPEITNRYELTFSVANSTKTLEQASGERIATSNISTNSTSATGAYYFLFQQYGITWAKTSVPLPVNNGLLDCNIVSQAPVSLLAGTADIGYVRLTAENLASNPSTFANLQIVGANLEVEDQQAIGFLTSIDGYSNSINISTTSIASSNVSMESRLVNIDTKMITLSNEASTKTLTQTGENWTTDYTTLQSLTLSNVGGTVFSYVKLYNKATAPDQNDTPVMTIPLNHESVQQVVCNSLLFDLGIGVRATNAFVANNNTAPSGTVYATAFYKLG